MPIRFRCAYCNQLMGISHRKAGTVVRCPKCAGEIIVPVPEGVAPAGDAAPQTAGDPVAMNELTFEPGPNEPAPTTAAAAIAATSASSADFPSLSTAVSTPRRTGLHISLGM